MFPLKSRPPRGRLKQRRSSFRPNCVSGTDRLRHHVSTLHQHLHRKVEKHLDRIWQSEVLQGGGAERFESISTTYSFLLLRNFFFFYTFFLCRNNSQDVSNKYCNPLLSNIFYVQTNERKEWEEAKQCMRRELICNLKKVIKDIKKEMQKGRKMLLVHFVFFFLN